MKPAWLLILLASLFLAHPARATGRLQCLLSIARQFFAPEVPAFEGLLERLVLRPPNGGR